jgi:hypothetical protein
MKIFGEDHFSELISTSLYRMIGAALIVVGLYLVLWGKTEEKKQENQDDNRTLTKHLLDANGENKDCSVRTDIP